MNSCGPGHLCQPGERDLDVPGSQHHQIGEFINHNHQVGQLLQFAIFIRLINRLNLFIVLTDVAGIHFG